MECLSDNTLECPGPNATPGVSYSNCENQRKRTNRRVQLGRKALGPREPKAKDGRSWRDLPMRSRQICPASLGGAARGVVTFGFIVAGSGPGLAAT